jgi:hypothetical protein
MFIGGSRKAFAAGALAAALFIAGCASQGQLSQNPLSPAIAPGGVLLQQPAPALNLAPEAQIQRAAGEFGSKTTTTLESRFSVNLDVGNGAVQAQESVLVKSGCGMP